MKLGNIIVSLLLVGLLVSIFGLYFAQMATNYSQTYDNDDFSLYNQSAALQQQIEDINSTLNSVNPEESTDASFVTAFLGSGWSVIKTTFQSFGIFNTVAGEAITESGVDQSGLFKTYGLAIGAVIFFMVVIGIIVGRDLI